ncbi:MAG: Holliday junction resolvase RuvX [Bacillaceae bacterium]|nr:Holliday junction resolvase RuvX [Bacillaceae bacterium]
MKILGLDVGEKTIGVAVSDDLGWTAQGIKTIKWDGNFNTVQDELKTIITEHEIEKVVVGLPKNMNGTIGERGEACQQFASTLKEKLNINVELWDERLTTMAAERILLSADMSRSKRKKVIDKMAAVMILQSYMDAKN